MAYDPTDWTTADSTAKSTAQHFYTDTGGAHVADGSGAQATVSSTGLDLTDSGGTVAAYFHSDEAQIGADTESHVKVEQSAIGMWAQWNPTHGVWQLVKVLNLYYNGSYAHFDAPASGLWLGSATGNTVIAAADGDSSGEVVLRGGHMTVRDENGNQLWKGTAQQLADALNGSTPDPVMYGGSVVKTVTASREITVFSNAEVRSMFGVASGKENQIGVSIMNGDYGAQAHRVTSINYRSSSGWNMYLDGNASAGAFRINYIVAVPSSALS